MLGNTWRRPSPQCNSGGTFDTTGKRRPREWFGAVVRAVDLAHVVGVMHGDLGRGCLVLRGRVRLGLLDGILYEECKRIEHFLSLEFLDRRVGATRGIVGDFWGFRILVFCLLTGFCPF